MSSQTPDDWLMEQYENSDLRVLNLNTWQKRPMFEVIKDHPADCVRGYVRCKLFSGASSWPEPEPSDKLGPDPLEEAA